MANGNSPLLTLRVPERQRMRWEHTSYQLGYTSLSAFVKAQCEDAARTIHVCTVDAEELRELRRALNRAADGLERAASAAPYTSTEADISHLVQEIEQIVATLNTVIR